MGISVSHQGLPTSPCNLGFDCGCQYETFNSSICKTEIRVEWSIIGPGLQEVIVGVPDDITKFRILFRNYICRVSNNISLHTSIFLGRSCGIISDFFFAKYALVIVLITVCANQKNIPCLWSLVFFCFTRTESNQCTIGLLAASLVIHRNINTFDYAHKIYFQLHSTSQLCHKIFYDVLAPQFIQQVYETFIARGMWGLTWFL